ncbi:MAG: hypothetical protein QGH74_09180 [Candidatus Brocadiia bacterium]|jgi:hypothetical protein|nr:hypothetical protein [Candidatus Brocadiia bacterium]
MKLTELTPSQKVILSLFIVCLGVGFLVAQGHMFLTHRGSDGQPGLGLQDIKIAFAGDPESTRLKTYTLGSMAQHFSGDKEAQERLITWIDDGAKEQTFEPIQQILDNYCTSCHHVGSGTPGADPLTSYEEVAALNRPDNRGPSLEHLARVSHIHLIPIAVMFLLAGLIFTGTAVGERWKVLVVSVAMLAVLSDVASWWLTRFVWREFAVLIGLSGALMGCTLAVMCLAGLASMWRKR